VRAWLAAAVLLAAVAGCATAADPAPAPGAGSKGANVFTNPVYSKDAPDPQVVKGADGRWYLFHTNSRGQNVPTLVSPDLVTWSEGPDALPKLPAWADPGKTWAPEVIALAPDRYVMYYTVADRASGRQCLGRAVASSPAGPYVDDSPKALICQADEGGSIDASPFRDTDGSLYLLWKNDGNAVRTDTWIYVQKLTPDGLGLVGSASRLIKQSEPWEGTLVEGPFFWRRDGKLFLFYSANAYYDERYAMGYAVCESPTGPCVKAAENPILRTNAVASGPGHGMLVEHAGRTWLVYHAWPPGQEGTVSPGRQVWLDEVVWDGGKPRVKGPTKEPQARP
jgi:beta-xylosidase